MARAALLRALVPPGGTEVQMPDGSVVATTWTPSPGCIKGQEMMFLCPGCGGRKRVLTLAPGEEWRCVKCRPISHPSERRPGNGTGGKGASWHLARLDAQQRRALETLELAAWPPPRLVWSLEDLQALPRKPGAAALSPARVQALQHRIWALELLKLDVAAGLVRSLQRRVAGGDDVGAGDEVPGGLDSAERLERSTRWAVRTPAHNWRFRRQKLIEEAGG